MRSADRLALLEEFYRDKLALYRRHVEGAKSVPGYEFNNTYQYVIAREDAHLRWLSAAIRDAGGAGDDSGEPPAVPPGVRDGGRAVIEDDARSAKAFVSRWRPRVGELPDGSLRKMLELILGEVSEHQRFFDQAMAGRDDLLGRRPAGAGTGGGVLPTRWVE